MFNGYSQVDISGLVFQNNSAVITKELYEKFTTGKPLYITEMLEKGQNSSFMFPFNYHNTDFSTIGDIAAILSGDLSGIIFYFGNTISLYSYTSTEQANVAFGSAAVLFIVGYLVEPETGNYLYLLHRRAVTI